MRVPSIRRSPEGEPIEPSSELRRSREPERPDRDPRAASYLKSIWIAYALHLLGGGGYLGLHRFYLGYHRSAKLQLGLSAATFVLAFASVPTGLRSLLIVPAVTWYVLDLFLIPGLLRERNAAIRQSLETADR
ncbi:NINE protein [Consotaella aegiceratis]|uniref:NINE protein n=1 Tax=Consotaella aegiceratis TaxID=3097961 RepID=UPI002F405CAB